MTEAANEFVELLLDPCSISRDYDEKHEEGYGKRGGE